MSLYAMKHENCPTCQCTEPIIEASSVERGVGRVDYRAFGHSSVEWFAGCPSPGTILYAAQPDLADENYKLRMLLFAAHGARPGCLLYGDDGERTCNSCGIDFVRDSVADIERKVRERWMRELEKLVSEGKWPPNN